MSEMSWIDRVVDNLQVQGIAPDNIFYSAYTLADDLASGSIVVTHLPPGAVPVSHEHIKSVTVLKYHRTARRPGDYRDAGRPLVFFNLPKILASLC